MISTIFTGQEIVEISHGTEHVKCARCKSDDTVGLHTTAWWDSEINKYVHKGCIPEEQLQRRLYAADNATNVCQNS